MKVFHFFVLGAIAFAPVASAKQSTTGGATDTTAPSSQSEEAKRIRVGGNVQQAKLLHQAMPVYPKIAKDAHVEGTVVLHAIIAKDGSVKQLNYVSGPPLLMKSAMDAVQQWVYEPTKLAGEPVEVDTTITVIFTLGKDTSLTESTGVDPKLKADIVQMLEVMRAQEKAQSAMRSIFETMRTQLIASLPATPNREKIVTSYEDKLAALFDRPQFIEGMIAIYAKYFSDDDVKAMIQFYQTPTGQRVIEHLPEVASDSMQFGQHLAADNLDAIMAELCTEYPELKGEAKFCPKSDEKISRVIRPEAIPFGVPPSR